MFDWLLFGVVMLLGGAAVSLFLLVEWLIWPDRADRPTAWLAEVADSPAPRVVRPVAPADRHGPPVIAGRGELIGAADFDRLDEWLSGPGARSVLDDIRDPT